MGAIPLPLQQGLPSSLNLALSCILSWYKVRRAGSLLRPRNRLGQPGAGGPPPPSSGFCQDKAAWPFLAVHIQGFTVAFPGFELALACLEGLFLAHS